MRPSTTTVSEVKDAFARLILWGKEDLHQDIQRTRYDVFEDLFEGLTYLEQQVTDADSLGQLKKSRALAEEAREFYRAGNFRGGMLTIQEAHEHFMEVRVKSKRGKSVRVPTL